MMRTYWILLAACGALAAQQVVAPTPEQVGSPRGENAGNYNITNSFEVGYRWALVGGDEGMYRSTVNYRNGIRLLGSNFSMDSKDGHGHYFDQILLNTLGLGNDPYQSAILRVQKNGLYRYDMHWRQNDYSNPGLTIAGGLHEMDTVMRLQDHEFTLFPQGHYRLRAGYSRNVQEGPMLSTSLELDNNSLNSSGLPVFANLRQTWNEYRIGADVEFAGFRFTVLRRWDYFKEDTPYSAYGIATSAALGISNDLTTIQTFTKAQPVHGRNPGWLGNLLATHKMWAVNARMSYLEGHDDFAMSEFATGLSRFGDAANRQISVIGNGDRPTVTGDLNLSFFPTKKLTIVNNTSVNSLRINGNSAYTDIIDGSNSGQTIYFRYLGIRMVTNMTDVNYQVKGWVAIYGEYGYTDRLVKTEENFFLPAFPSTTPNDVYDNSNHLNTGTIGVRARIWKPLTASVEAGIGRANNPLTPISARDYHTINGRVDYRTRKVQLGTSYKQFYNVNAPVSLSDYSSHTRNYTASGTWVPNDWFSVDASYVKLHLDTVSGVAYFAGIGRPTLQTATTFYRSNIHAGNLGVRYAFRKKADLYVGYTITQDTGDGRPTATGNVTDPAPALLASVQQFPLSYQSPLARVSVVITPKIRWNVGYQFYNYNEKFGVLGFYQNFHANTGFSSVTWMF
uniref:Uncharacterized protein n=1 Tax=Solibacter usitatus (strain Ellin6076) TaxID=234267 RepID=Q01RS4_SOLUE